MHLTAKKNNLTLTFFQNIPFSLYFVTWNVGTKDPENIELENLLGLEKSPENDKQRPDFYIIGLQEVNSQPQNILANLIRTEPWTKKFKEVLKKRDYVVTKSENLQGLLLVIFVQRKHLLHIRNVETETTKTGFGGLWVCWEISMGMLRF